MKREMAEKIPSPSENEKLIEMPQQAKGFIRLLEVVVAMFLIAIMLIISMQVVCRYILRDLPSWSEELSRYLFIWANLLGAGVALARGSHVSIDNLVSLFPDSVGRKLESMVVILVTTFSLFLLYQGTIAVIAMR